MEHVVAIDVGGTEIKGALVGVDGNLLVQESRKTQRERGPEAVVSSITEFALELRDDGKRRFGRSARAAGVAVPGVIDEAAGTAVFAAYLGWRDVPLSKLLGEHLSGIPVALGHDVRTGAFAEQRIGAGRDVDRFIFLTIGTGIGGAIGLGGDIESGAHGTAGEIGHMVIRPGGTPCPCGQRGCLDQYASASAVARAWGAVSGSPDASECATACAAGDQRARVVWMDAVDALADGLVAAVTMLDPQAVIIGGGLAEAGETLFGPLRDAVRARLTFQRPPDIRPAALGGNAGCSGAGLMAWRALKDPVA